MAFTSFQITFQLICCVLEMECVCFHSDSADNFRKDWCGKNRGECLWRLSWKCVRENLREKKNLSLEPSLFLLLLNFPPCRVRSLYKKPLRGEFLCSSGEKPKPTSRINPAVVQPWMITWDLLLYPSVTEDPQVLSSLAQMSRNSVYHHHLNVSNLSTVFLSFEWLWVSILFRLCLAGTEKHPAPFLTKFSHHPMRLRSPPPLPFFMN